MLNFFKHEFKLIWREPRFWIPFLIPPFFIIGSQLYLQTHAPTEAVGDSLLILIGVLLSTMCVNLMADSFAGERERNTLELLLALPISIEKIFFGKMLAVFPVPLAISMVFQLMFWNLTPYGFTELGIALLTNVSSCFFVGTISLSVSMFSSTVRTAAQISVVFVLLILIVTPVYSVYIFQSAEIVFIVNSIFIGVSMVLTSFSFRVFKRKMWIK